MTIGVGVVLGLICLFSGCSGNLGAPQYFMPAALNASEVPAGIRNSMESLPSTANWKYCVVRSEDGETMVGCQMDLLNGTYFAGPGYAVALYSDVDRQLQTTCIVGCLTDQAFQGTYGVISGGAEIVLNAGGTAFDRRITEVVGQAEGGEMVRTTPVEGFWVLVLSGSSTTRWRSIRALDAEGRELYALAVRYP